MPGVSRLSRERTTPQLEYLIFPRDLHLERVEHEAELEGALLGALLRVARAEVAAVKIGAHESLALLRALAAAATAAAAGR